MAISRKPKATAVAGVGVEAQIRKGGSAAEMQSVSDVPAGSRLVIRSPGALNPRLPKDAARLDVPSGRPCWSQAATGMTHGWRVMAELLIMPWFPAAATMSTPRDKA